MLDWLKASSRLGRSDALYALLSETGVSWARGAQAGGRRCDSQALEMLEQLECEGLVHALETGFEADWERAYSILTHSEFRLIAPALGFPPFGTFRVHLQSVGTLTDAEFGIAMAGYSWRDGRQTPIEVKAVSWLRSGDEEFLLDYANVRLLKEVQAFWQRRPAARTETENRRMWGRIRRLALEAEAALDDFLYRSIVLTPERLQLDLSRTMIGGVKVVEVVPGFQDCPAEWLTQFDTSGRVLDRYDIPTPDGIVQVIISPAVRTVLEQIKAMPGRRAAGARAEAFITNPFATLGEAAVEVLDPEQFEHARQEAGLLFERFTAIVEKNAVGEPIRVGILIERAPTSEHGPSSETYFFSSLDEGDSFVARARQNLAANLQVYAWQDYEFELLGNTALELGLLEQALESLRNPAPIIRFDKVFDLTTYSDRVAEIGAQKPFYSPFIAKKDDGEGWFPANLVPLIAWPAENGESVMVPISPKVEALLEQKLAQAQKNGECEIETGILPKPISVNDAQGILEAFEKARNAKGGEIPELVRQKTGEPRSPSHRPTLVIKANIENIDYERFRRELLTVVGHQPVLPKRLRSGVSLKDHQIEGLGWLQHLYRLSPGECHGAVLADDMGLGKTLQLLSLISWIFDETPDAPPALIVAPVTLLENWQAEAHRFFEAGALPITTLYGDDMQALRVSKTEVDRALQDRGLVKFLRPGWAAGARVVLTTYETLRDLEFSIAAQAWSVLICDEAQKIKNPNALVTRAAKKQKARFSIACTGTPVENTLADLWCLFDLIQPGMLGALNTFGSRYRKPIEAKTEEEKERVEELRERIKPQILRRTKQEVAKDLPRKIIVEDCRRIPIGPFQLTLYSQAVELFRKRDEPGARIPFKNHLGLLHYLRTICTDPRPIGTESTTSHSLAEIERNSPKLKWLMEQLTHIQRADEKVIIFCEFRGVQRQLRHYVKERFGVAPDIVNGDTSASAADEQSRQKRIQAFQNKPGFNIIVLSPVAVGFGVNIQAANHVIHYTRTWNPAKEDQATDRAYRIGQTRDVFVYYPVIVAPDFMTFEMKLDKLLEYKRELAQDMLNGAGDVRPGDFSIHDVVSGADGATLDLPVGSADLAAMSPKYFEGLAAALWQAQGYRVHRTPDSGDDGVDVVAYRTRDGVLIQCKSSTAEGKALGWDAIKEVVAGAASYRRKYPEIDFSLICMTNRTFNSRAREHANLNGVTLIEGDGIANLLREHPIRKSDIEAFLFTTWANEASQ